MDLQEAASVDLKGLDEILASIPDAGPSDLIPILQKIQTVYGYLPPAVLNEQFHLEPHGRHTIRCCRGTACHVKGAPNIVGAIEQAVGVEPGQTTDDLRFTFETVACLGTCFLAPVMMVNDDYYGHLSAGKVKGILEGYA
ncbi:MAG: NADH-quinone oxidoreductase subunit NuoE family protein [Planctomycetota bacterium]|jgi:NADH-quinone oxidoreductase subunit E